MKPKQDNLLKKIRIIINDPYATDESSSSDEDLPKVKRVVYEINLPSKLPKKPTRPSKKHVGVRQRPSGAEITNPITATYGTHKKAEYAKLTSPASSVVSANRHCLLSPPPCVNKSLNEDVAVSDDSTNENLFRLYLSDLETPDLSFLAVELDSMVCNANGAEKDYAHKKVEYTALTSPRPPVSLVVSVNSHCLPSKENKSLNEDVAVSDDSINDTLSNIDLSDLQIPDLSLLAAEKDAMVSNANGAELDLDRFFMDDLSGHLLDDFSWLHIDIPSDGEDELSDLKCRLRSSTGNAFH